MRLWKKKHDCRRSLPNPWESEAGTIVVCPDCGRKNRRGFYHDDDEWGNFTEFACWRVEE